MQDLNCVFQGLDGKGAIFISTIHAARNISLLKKHNIGAVLSIARGAYIHFSKQEVSHYLYLPADDISSYDLSQHFQQTHQFIESVRKQTNVLVHCMAGISRSATITAAYLMRKFGYSLEKVLKHIQRKRTKIYPNPGFMKQLRALERRLIQEKKQKEEMFNSMLVTSKKQQYEKFGHTRSPSASPNLSPAKIVTPPTSADKNKSLSKEKFCTNVFQNAINLVQVPTTPVQKSSPSPRIKRSRSINISFKIDRIKQALYGKGKIFSDTKDSEFLSPCKKVYSPLLYKNRPKLGPCNY